MSANNFLLIKQLSQRKFDILNMDAETHRPYRIGSANSLRGAIEKAQKYMTKNIVEYGIEFELLRKKKYKD